MSRQEPKLHSQRKEKELPSLKKIPARKSASRSQAKQNKNIVVSAKARKEFASILEIIKRKVPGAPRTKMPTNIKPMLATLVDEPFSDSGWQFELKLDGYRTLAYLKSGQVDLRSRKNNSFNKQFDVIAEALTEWKIDAVIDGEVVVLNEEGKPDFNKIQLWDTKREGHLVYYVFDLLWIDGLDIMNEPLHVRREILRELMPESGTIRYSDHIDDIGNEFFEVARKNNLEGIVAKKKDSVYFPDSRARTWLKIKVEERHEAVICGYTRKRDTDRLFSSLILGVYEKGNLKFIGQTGTGFTEQMQEELTHKMKPHITRKLPFDEKPSIPGSDIVWLKPYLVCEVKYTELTNEGLMRHASFQGLREDKAAFELNNEEEKDTEKIIEEIEKEENELINISKESQIVSIDGHDLKLTNLKKVYWPKERIT
ncbi:MAG: non-homologous end-joining DNA ligase, partial [Flavisolibacter sp.]